MEMPIGQIIASYRRRKRQIQNDRPWTQEDLAVAIGSDKAHVNRIERGRQRPARDTLLRICRALDMPWDDEQGLLLAAGHAPDLHLPTGAELDRIVAWAAQIVDGLSHPAVLLDAIGRIWYCNPTGLAFFSSAAGISADKLTALCRGKSLLDLLSTLGETTHLAQPFVSEAFIRSYVARSRQMVGFWQHTPEYQATVVGLLQNPRFARMWRETAAASVHIAFANQAPVTYHHPQMGTLRVELWSARLQMDSRFFISHHLPADEPTRALFERLRASG